MLSAEDMAHDGEHVPRLIDTGVEILLAGFDQVQRLEQDGAAGAGEGAGQEGLENGVGCQIHFALDGTNDVTEKA